MLTLEFWNVLCTIINLVLLYILLKKFLFGPVISVLEKRKALLEGQFASASEMRKTAMELKKQYETSIRTVEAESAQILQKAREDGETEYRRIVGEASEKADRMVAQAQAAIVEEKEKALKDMESDIASLAVDVAKKILEDDKGGWF